MSKLNANKSTPKTKMNLRSTGSMSTPANPDRQCQEVLKNLLSKVNEEGESIIDIIRKVVKEELLNHEIKIKELIDTNVKHTNEGLDQLSSDINDLKESLEFTEQDIDKKLVKVANELKDLKTDIKAIENNLLNADEVSDNWLNWKIRLAETTFRLVELKNHLMKPGKLVKIKLKMLLKRNWI